jgi:hypothetical protein
MRMDVLAPTMLSNVIWFFMLHIWARRDQHADSETDADRSDLGDLP